jgi:hypothetical protein
MAFGNDRLPEETSFTRSPGDWQACAPATCSNPDAERIKVGFAFRFHWKLPTLFGYDSLLMPPYVKGLRARCEFALKLSAFAIENDNVLGCANGFGIADSSAYLHSTHTQLVLAGLILTQVRGPRS